MVLDVLVVTFVDDTSCGYDYMYCHPNLLLVCVNVNCRGEV